MHHFIKESRIAAPPAAVFAFHESPGAIQALIPPWEHVRVVEPPKSLEPGTRVILSIRIGPFAVTWVAEHTEYVSGKLFVDRQVRGPFAYWLHRHRFLDDGQGGTILRDEVDYRPPLGMLGDRLAGPMVERRLRRMFDYRHEATRRTVESRGRAASDDGSRGGQ